MQHAVTEPSQAIKRRRQNEAQGRALAGSKKKGQGEERAEMLAAIPVQVGRSIYTFSVYLSSQPLTHPLPHIGTSPSLHPCVGPLPGFGGVVGYRGHDQGCLRTLPGAEGKPPAHPPTYPPNPPTIHSPIPPPNLIHLFLHPISIKQLTHPLQTGGHASNHPQFCHVLGGELLPRRGFPGVRKGTPISHPPTHPFNPLQPTPIIHPLNPLNQSKQGVSLFGWPHVKPLWTRYLDKFVGRYAGSKLERARDLFEQCLEKVPPEEAAQYYIQVEKPTHLPTHPPTHPPTHCPTVAHSNRLLFLYLPTHSTRGVQQLI